MTKLPRPSDQQSGMPTPRPSGARIRVSAASLPLSRHRPSALLVGNAALRPLLDSLDPTRIDAHWAETLPSLGGSIAVGSFDVIVIHESALDNIEQDQLLALADTSHCRSLVICGNRTSSSGEVLQQHHVLVLSADCPAADCAGTIMRIAGLEAEVKSYDSEHRVSEQTEGDTDTAKKLLGHLMNELANVSMAVQPSLAALEELSQKEPLILEHAASCGKAWGRLNGYVRDVCSLIGDARNNRGTATLRVLERFVDAYVDVAAPNQRFISRLAQNLWPVPASEEQLALVCEKLVENARSATVRGGEIRLEAENVTVREAAMSPYDLSPGQYVRIRVIDDGIGMSELTLRQAGEPFYSTWGEDSHWRGLGIAQVRAICRRARGQFALSSKVGRGTVATVWLPRAESLDRGSALPQLCASVLPASRFLIVDDEPQILAGLSRGLRELGHAVYLAQDSATALSILEEETDCNYAVIDLHLGRSSGQDLAGEIARRFSSLQVVMTSGFEGGRSASFDASSSERVVPFLRKPFGVGELLATLGAVSPGTREE